LAVSLVSRLRERGWGVGAGVVRVAPNLRRGCGGRGRRCGGGAAEWFSGGCGGDHAGDAAVGGSGQAAQVEVGVCGGRGRGWNVADVYPLAPLQEGIFFHHLLVRTGEADVYLVPTVVAFPMVVSGWMRLCRRCSGWWTGMEHLPHGVGVGGVAGAGAGGVAPRGGPVTEVTLPETGDPAAELQAVAGSWMDLRRAPLLGVHVGGRAGQWPVAGAGAGASPVAGPLTALEVVMGEVRGVQGGAWDELPAPLPFRDFVAQAGWGSPGRSTRSTSPACSRCHRTDAAVRPGQRPW